MVVLTLRPQRGGRRAIDERVLMHQELRELLRDASGESEFVLAANIDIRGFSSFFSDSSQAAAFLSSAYTTILDSYFPDLSFFKPTGDGLLLVRAIDRNDLQDTVSNYVDAALRLDADFGDICASDDLINFETPARVGIGLARGTATRITSGNKVLDYSGYPLNLASRLMDLARPGGVVFDESLGAHLLSDQARDRFGVESVYVKGLADLTPISVFATAGISVPDANRRPIGAEIFFEKAETSTFTQFAKRGPTFMHRLTHRPSALDSVKLHITFPKADENGTKLNNVVRTRAVEAKSMEEHEEGLIAAFDYDDLVQSMKAVGIKGTWPVTTKLAYSVPIGTVSAKSAADDTSAPPPMEESGPGSP